MGIQSRPLGVVVAALQFTLVLVAVAGASGSPPSIRSNLRSARPQGDQPRGIMSLSEVKDNAVWPKCKPVRQYPWLPVPLSDLEHHSTFVHSLLSVATESCEVALLFAEPRMKEFVINFVHHSAIPTGLPLVVVELHKGIVCNDLPDKVPCLSHPGLYVVETYRTTRFPEVVPMRAEAESEVLVTAINLGFNVLRVDPHVVLRSNPYDFLLPSDAHVQIWETETGALSSSFMRFRASSMALSFAGDIFQESMDKDDGFHAAMVKAWNFWRNVEDPLVRVQKLTYPTIQSGESYFLGTRRQFADQQPCDNCAVVVTGLPGDTIGKLRYRLREHLVWSVDTDKYYSSETTTYLEYPMAKPDATRADELVALANGLKLARASGRDLILPKFRCHKCSIRGSESFCAGTAGVDVDECSYQANWEISTLIPTFGTAVREAMFRHNPLTHERVRLQMGDDGASSTPTVALRPSDAGEPNVLILPQTSAKLASGDSVEAATILQDLRSLGLDKVPVVRFASLYGVDVRLTADQEAQFATLWSTAVVETKQGK